MLPAFANILFSGPCNLACTFCIGRLLPSRPNNLNALPLQNLSPFLDQLRALQISEISLTATNTDPLLYRHSFELIQTLRQTIPRVRINLHTNGLLALQRLDFINACDRITLSLTSLNPATALALSGNAHVLDLSRLLDETRVPIKISTVLLPENIGEIPHIVRTCQSLGIKRLSLRKLVSPQKCQAIGELNIAELLAQKVGPPRFFGQNPVYDLPNLEVTVWDFSKATLNCLNLFSDGTITDNYALLPACPEAEVTRQAAAA